MRFKFWRKDPHKVTKATIVYPKDDSFRMYPVISIVFGNGNTYKVDVNAVYEHGQEVGRQLEREEKEQDA